MPTVTQPKNLGDLLKYGTKRRISTHATRTPSLPRRTCHWAPWWAATATAKLETLDPSATDGTETAVGVLGNDVDATLIDREDAILIARHAIVARGAVIWPTGITPAQKASAEAHLTFLGVLVRDSA